MNQMMAMANRKTLAKMHRSRRELDALYILENAVLCARVHGETLQHSRGVHAATAALLTAIDAELAEVEGEGLA